MADIEALKNSGYLQRTLDVIERETSFTASQPANFKDLLAYPSSANFILIKLLRGEADEIKANFLSKGILIRSCSSFKDLGEKYARALN